MTPTGTSHLAQSERVQALRRYHVLDTPPEPQFDDLAALAAQVSGFPIAAITFIDEQREWVKAAYGCELSDVSINGSLGAHAIAAGAGPTTVADATADESLAQRP